MTEVPFKYASNFETLGLRDRRGAMNAERAMSLGWRLAVASSWPKTVRRHVDRIHANFLALAPQPRWSVICVGACGSFNKAKRRVEVMPNVHESYAKEALRMVFGDRFNDRVGTRSNEDPSMAGVIIDGTIDSNIAVEIAAGIGKTVDADASRLARHELRFKLLIVVPAGMHNAETAAARARDTLAGPLDSCQFRVVVLRGTGHDRRLAEDVEKLRTELNSWPAA